MVDEKPLVWLHGEVKTPPFSPAGRVEAGFLLRRLQMGENLSLPSSRPMPAVGADDAVVILEVFSKKTRTTPKRVVDSAKARLKKYQRDAE